MRRAIPSAPARGGTRSRAIRIALGVSALALVLFHLRLLWLRVSDQTVLEPWIAAKWLASALLVVALWRLKVAGRRLFTGKRAAVIWLVALLLHVQLPVAPSAASPLTGALEPGSWLMALPVGVSMGAALALALALGLALLAAATPRRAVTGLRASTLRLGAPLAGASPTLVSRPPPAVS